MNSFHLSTQIVIIENEADGPVMTRIAEDMLRQFCYWQEQHYSTPDDSDPAHYDLAILLTSENICGDSCDTLGKLLYKSYRCTANATVVYVSAS